MMTRIITGLVLTAVVWLVMLWSSLWLFATLALAILFMAWLEWVRLELGLELSKSVWHNRLPSPLAICGVVFIIVALVLFRMPQVLPKMCLGGLLLWIVHAIVLARKCRARDNVVERHTPRMWSGLLHGMCIFLFAWCALVWMYSEQGALLCIAMLLVVWSTDTFAYFVGKCFGKNKLAPTISPNKTIEGFLGGVLGAGLVALWLATMGLGLNTPQAQGWLLASLSAILFSVVGDLHESWLKRRAGVKDSSSLLPGHGGILDRVDGLVAAVPAFTTIWWLFG